MRQCPGSGKSPADLPRFVAVGAGYVGGHETEVEARATVDRNGHGAVYVRIDLVHSAVSAAVKAGQGGTG